MRLDTYRNDQFRVGVSRPLEAVWILISTFTLSSWLPGSLWRAMLLRTFGAEIGKGVVIKPRVRVKYPWRLKIGDFSWIGEGVWIDNLTDVRVGNHVCISQGTYLCTGSHDWASTNFDLILGPIHVKDHAWLCAMTRVGPGVTIDEGAVVAFGRVVTCDVEPWCVKGLHATRPRILRTEGA